MEEAKLKILLEGLWKESFGDSSLYVSQFLDTYVKNSLVAFHKDLNGIDAAMIGIPYLFGSVGGNSVLKGLYLLFIAPKILRNKEDVVNSLLNDLQNKARDYAYDFTFIIPNGVGLTEFYRNRGYHDAFFKYIEYYVKGHKFANESSLTVKELTPEDELSELINFLSRQVSVDYNNTNNKSLVFELHHDSKDWHSVISSFLSVNKSVFVATREKKVVGVAIGCFTQEGKKRKTLEIHYIDTNSDDASNEELLKGVEQLYPDCSITILRNLSDLLRKQPRPQLWNPFFAQSNGIGAQYEEMSEFEQPYNPSTGSFPTGMVKILDIHGLLKKIGMEGILSSLKGCSDEDLVRVIMRRPSLSRDENSLEYLLDIPDLILSMSLVPFRK